MQFLVNKNSELAVPPLSKPVNGIKIGEHVALLNGTSDYLLFFISTCGYLWYLYR